jgi:ribonuclease HI
MQHSNIAGSLHVATYTDGASRGNPGPASCGGVIYLAKDKLGPEQDETVDPIYGFGTHLGVVTNNEAEYKGLIQALEAACEMGATHVTSYVDSQLVCRQVQGLYQVNKTHIVPLHARCMTLISQLQRFTIHHVIRAFNTRADNACNLVLDAVLSPWKPDVPDMTDSKVNGLSTQQHQELERKKQKQQQTDQVEKNQVRPAAITQAEIDACWEQLHTGITDTAQACIGEVKVTSQAKAWWAIAPDIHALHDTYVRRRRVMRKLKHDNTASTDVRKASRKGYLEARAAFLAAAPKAKSKEWDAVAAACDDTNDKKKHKIVWSKWKRTKPSTRVPAASFPDAQGKPPRTHTQALNNMVAHLASISSPSYDVKHDAEHEQHVRDYLRLHVPEVPVAPKAPSFTLADVEKACSTFRLNTALGSDNVSPYFLRYGGKTLQRAVWMLFSMCSWYGVVPTSFRHGHVMPLYKGEGEATDPNNYRPISITSVLARVYERIHKHELISSMLMHGIPSKERAVRVYATAQHT